MLYRLSHAINSSYGLAVAWAYIGAFIIALSLLFIFPQVTLLMFFLGLASLGLAIALGWVIDSFTRMLARRVMRSGACPRCRDKEASRYNLDESWICGQCGSEFKADGSETSQSERARFIEQVPDARA